MAEMVTLCGSLAACLVTEKGAGLAAEIMGLLWVEPAWIEPLPAATEELILEEPSEVAEPNHGTADTSTSSSRSLEQSTKMWRRVENTGLLAKILPLLDAENLSRAGSVSRIWRAAANERDWLQVCNTFPLLAEIKAEDWCELSYRQLFAQMKYAEYTAERTKRPSSKAFGPALRHEYFDTVPLDADLADGNVLTGDTCDG